jgi:hypothetical protein
MPMPKDAFQSTIHDQLLETWRMYVKNLESSLKNLETALQDADEMRDVCTDEWCQATEHVIDDLSNSLFSISEPRGSSEEDSKRIRTLRKKLHDMYAEYKRITA